MGTHKLGTIRETSSEPQLSVKLGGADIAFTISYFCKKKVLVTELV